MARVLVVDDALMMRKTIGTFLVKAGHEVEEAANGKQAVDVYKRQRPDLVTMDITMPELDGIEALLQITAFDPQARVVMVSALGQKHKVFDALQKGAKGYILKPFTEDKLLAIIDELLGATTGSTKEIPPDLTVMNSYEVKPLTAKMAFSIETREGRVRIAVLREFATADYEDMVKAIKNIRLGLPTEIIFDFTSGNGLSNKTVLPFKEIIEDAVAAGDSLRIVCHTHDYAAYFRSFSVVKEIEFELIKKVSA
ncbi:MAG: cheB 5 [Firmicutes bacterium]|nr:cheB 5 [Bacillota bacterium]